MKRSIVIFSILLTVSKAYCMEDIENGLVDININAEKQNKFVPLTKISAKRKEQLFTLLNDLKKDLRDDKIKAEELRKKIMEGMITAKILSYCTENKKKLNKTMNYFGKILEQQGIKPEEVFWGIQANIDFSNYDTFRNKHEITKENNARLVTIISTIKAKEKEAENYAQKTLAIMAQLEEIKNKHTEVIKVISESNAKIEIINTANEFVKLECQTYKNNLETGIEFLDNRLITSKTELETLTKQLQSTKEVDTKYSLQKQIDELKNVIKELESKKSVCATDLHKANKRLNNPASSWKDIWNYLPSMPSLSYSSNNN